MEEQLHLLMVAGASIKEVSRPIGYRQPTAFVTMFRASLDITPKISGRTLRPGSLPVASRKPVTASALP